MSSKRRNDSYGNIEPSSKYSKTTTDDFHEALTLLEDNIVIFKNFLFLCYRNVE